MRKILTILFLLPFLSVKSQTIDFSRIDSLTKKSDYIFKIAITKYNHVCGISTDLFVEESCIKFNFINNYFFRSGFRIDTEYDLQREFEFQFAHKCYICMYSNQSVLFSIKNLGQFRF
jgi:hypothetical protein